MPTAEPRTAKGRTTRSRIVLAAAELVSERGVAGTSMDDVRERAHASKSQLYHYFADRDDLVRAVVRTTADAVNDGQDEAFAELASLAGLRRWAEGLVALQEELEARGGCPIGSLAGQLAERDEDARIALAAGFDRWETTIRRALETMVLRGELGEDADPARLAAQTLAALQGGLLLSQVRRDPGQLRLALDGALAAIAAMAA